MEEFMSSKQYQQRGHFLYQIWSMILVLSFGATAIADEAIEKDDYVEILISTATSENTDSNQDSMINKEFRFKLENGEIELGSNQTDVSSAETNPGDKLENQVIISLSGDDETVGGVLKIISTLTETEWDDLTQDEKEQIQSALNEIEEGIEIDVATKTGFFYAILAIMVVSFTLGLPVIVTAIILYYKHRKRRQRDAVIEKFINSGKDVPAELLASWELHPDESDSRLHQGIKLIAVSLGLYLFLHFSVGTDVALIAAIPLFLGIARLIIWKISQKSGPQNI
jgi:hypothetical protein